MQNSNSRRAQPKRPSQKKSVAPKNEKFTSKSTKNGARALSSKVSGASTYISTFVFVILAFLIYDNILSNDSVDFEALTSELMNNVHNQTSAVNTVLESLLKFQKYDKSVFLNFVGSTGVGKTFVANIVKKHFQPFVYETRNYNEILNKLKVASCKYSLVIIDDLTVLDTDNLLDFIQKIPQDIAVFVLSIFNIQETDDNLNHTINYAHINEIQKKFNSSGIIYEMAEFHEFSREQVREWIAIQLLIKGFDVENNLGLVETLLKDQNVKYHGLKGLSSKLNLEL